MPINWNQFSGGLVGGAQQGLGLVNQMRMAPIQQKMAEDELRRKQEMEQFNAPRQIAIGGQNYNVPEAQAANIAAQEDMKRLQMELMKQQRGQLPAGLKLRPGERYDPTTGRVEAIPGSTLEQDYIGKAAKDTQALSGVKQKAGGGVAAINEFLAKPGALQSQFGKGYTGVVSQYLNPDAKAKLETVKASIRGAGLDMMRSGGSIGQMTEREWPMVESMLATISPTMSEEEAQIQLQKVQAKLQNIQDQAEAIYKQEWEGTPYIAPKRPGVPFIPPKQQAGTQKTASGIEFTVEP